jgi:hypothetical protein
MPTPTLSIFLNSTTPAAPAGNQNVKPQSDGVAPLDSVSFYPQKATSLLLGVVKPDGSTTAVDVSGAISAIVMVGDSGAGGSKGIVPAPPAGSAAAGKFLKADGTFAVPPGTGITALTGDVTASGSGSVAATVKGINGVLLSSLATGLLKNTTGTGVPSIAVGADIPNIAESQVTNLTTDLAAKASISGVQQDSYGYAVDTGSANAYAVSLTPTPTLVAGSTGAFLAAHTNTGASTLAVNGGSAIAIKKNGNSTALAAGDISANQIIRWVYDGTVFQIIVPGSSGVTSLNSLTGALSIVAGTGITVTPSGSNITIASSAVAAAAVLTRQNYNSGAAGGRAYTTIYQNTSSFPMLVVIGDSALSTNLVAKSDSSATPTTVVWSMRTFSTANVLGGGAFLVMPSHYYQVTGSTLSGWNEYTFTKGTPTSSGNISGSRALGTVYQNTSGNPMFLQVSLSGTVANTSVIDIITDSSATPTTTLYRAGTASTTASGLAIIQPGDYYKVTCSGATIVTWVEVTVSGISVTKSANLFSTASKQNGPYRMLGTSTLGFINDALASRVSFVAASVNANGTLYTAADGYSTPVQLVNGIFGGSFPTNAPSTAIGVQGPYEFLSCYRDAGGTFTNIGWHEFVIT